MVQSVSGINPNNFNKTVLYGINKTKNPASKNIAKHIDLPAKLTLSALGIFGTNKALVNQKSDEEFKMTCNDYEASGDDYGGYSTPGPNCGPFWFPN